MEVDLLLAVERLLKVELEVAAPGARRELEALAGQPLQVDAAGVVRDGVRVGERRSEDLGFGQREVPAGGGARLKEGGLAEDAVVARRNGPVAVVEVELRGFPERDRHEVAPGVGGDADAVVGREVGAHLRVEVVEVELGRDAVLVQVLPQRCQQRLQRAPPRVERERPVLDARQRPLHTHAARQQSNGEAPVHLVAVAVLVVDVDDRAQAAAVRGRVGPLVQPDVLDGVGVERAEEAEEVGGVVDRGPVEQDEGLVRGAAADVEPAGEVRRRLHAREELDGAEEVRLKRRREVLHEADGHVHGPHRRGVLDGLVGLHDDLSERGLWRELHVEAERLAVLQAHAARLRGVADERVAERQGVRREAAQRVEPLHVGGRAAASGGAVHDEDVGADEGLARGRIADEPVDDGLGEDGLGREGEQEEQGEAHEVQDGSA